MLKLVNLQLLRFLMRRVLAAEAAILRKLDPLRRLLLVLRRAVIAALAFPAREMNDVAHDLLQYLRDRPGADRAAAFAWLFHRYRTHRPILDAFPKCAALVLAGQEGLEPPALGFGDRCSTN